MGIGDQDPEDSWAGPPLPPDDRLWRHPSEFGSHARPNPPIDAPVSAPPSRSGFGWALAGGAVVAVVAVVALELLGTIPETQVDTARGASVTLTSLSRPALTAVRGQTYDPPGIAWVSVDGSSPAIPGVVLDEAGHILVSADALATSEPEAVSCEGLTSRQVRVVGIDEDLGVALLDVGSPGWSAAEVTTIRPHPGEEISLVTQTTSGQGAVRGMVKASRSSLAFDAAVPIRHPAVAIDESGAVIALIATRAGQTVLTPIADALRAARLLGDHDPKDPPGPSGSTTTTTHR